MGQYFIQRLLLVIPTLLGVTLIGFLIMHLAPGDPAELRAGGGLGGARQGVVSRGKGGDAIDETVQQWRAQYGLDKPLHVQYVIWLKNFATLQPWGVFKNYEP